jgi:hypothetical protein
MLPQVPTNPARSYCTSQKLSIIRPYEIDITYIWVVIYVCFHDFMARITYDLTKTLLIKESTFAIPAQNLLDRPVSRFGANVYGTIWELYDHRIEKFLFFIVVIIVLLLLLHLLRQAHTRKIHRHY